MNLRKYTQGMNEDRYKQFADAVAVTMGESTDKMSLVANDPKLSIYFRAAICVAELYSEQERAYQLKALWSKFLLRVLISTSLNQRRLFVSFSRLGVWQRQSEIRRSFGT